MPALMPVSSALFLRRKKLIVVVNQARENVEHFRREILSTWRHAQEIATDVFCVFIVFCVRAAMAHSRCASHSRRPSARARGPSPAHDCAWKADRRDGRLA